MKHFMESDGSLIKTDPLIFAIKNEEADEIQISMHYDGLPIEPLRRFFKLIESKWKSQPLTLVKTVFLFILF